MNHAAEECRARAKEIRALAETDWFETTRETLILVAETYEDIARNMDKQEASRGHPLWAH